MTMTKGSFFIGICILASGVIVGASIWLTNHSRPTTPSREREDTSSGEPEDFGPGKSPREGDPAPITFHPLTGTLEINASCGGHWEGWFFINGKLQARLGLADKSNQYNLVKTFPLTPGEYEIRFICTNATEYIDFEQEILENQALRLKWRRDEVADELVCITGKVLIGQGQNVACQFKVSAITVPAFPSGFTINKKVFSRVPYRPENSSIITGDGTYEKSLFKLSEDLSEALRHFRDSDICRTILEGARLLPAAKSRIWLNLPDELGGSREVDVTQLRWLRKRLITDLDSRTAILPYFGRIIGGSKEAGEEGRRCQIMEDTLNKHIDDSRRAWNTMLKEMIAALENAPEGQ